MHVLVSGAGGLIGTALCASLRADGHRVGALVRREAHGPDEHTWDPVARTLDPGALAGVDAVVHLAGAGVGDRRWSDTYKDVILSSRRDGTATVARAVAEAGTPVLLSGSAVGFYGDRGDELLTETSPRGSGFLSDVVEVWEDATGPAAAAGARVAHLRTGLVMDPAHGAFAKLAPLLQLGLAGPLGSGRQWWPWITLDDEVRAIRFLLEHEVHGAVNLCAPDPCRNGDLTARLASRLHRPAVLPVPAFALRLVLGEFADDITASQRVLPQVLIDAGFTFAHPTADTGADWFVARGR